MESSIRPRLEKDVVKLVEKHRMTSGRTAPVEVNFALREYYAAKAAKKTAKAK